MRNLGILIALVLVSNIAFSATVSGTAFEWFSFEAVKDIIVEIDTTPNQTLVSPDGSYSFDVNPGTYTLTAQYFENNLLVYEASETVVIEEDGNFTIDLLMFPALGSDEFLLNDFNELDASIEVLEPVYNLPQIIGGVILVVIAFVLILFGARKITSSVTGLETERISLEEKYSKIPKEMAKALEEKPVEKPEKLDKELQEVLSILKKYGGRLTQKDLRDKLPHGEAKASLLIAELVEMGKIKKFKQGRGNVLVLKD